MLAARLPGECGERDGRQGEGQMFERFDKNARRAVARGKHEAVRAAQDHIGCEHLLLGIFAEEGQAAQALTAAGLEISALRTHLSGRTAAGAEPLDAEALASLGIDLDAVRRATDTAFGAGALDRAADARRGRRRQAFGPSFTPEARKTVELALRATVRMKQPSISTGHLLTGIIDQGHNAGLDLLAAAGVDVAALRADVLRRMSAAA
jgi:ATP-dependent Clp protease ATP-binding subunit ClpA